MEQEKKCQITYVQMGKTQFMSFKIATQLYTLFQEKEKKKEKKYWRN